MVKTLLFLLLTINAFALDPWNILHNDFLAVEEALNDIIKADDDFEKHDSAIPREAISKVLEDPDNRVSKDFDVPDYFKDSVIFWSQIYTQFTSQQVLIHDRDDLAIVYDALDYTHLYNAKISNYDRARKQNRITLKTIKKIKQSLIELSNRRNPKSREAKDLKKHLKKIGIKRPKNISRKSFYGKMARNIRAQTGLRDHIFQGIINSFAFEKFIFEVMDYFEMPRELLAISFVESSFNLKATSRVGASGVWQIMPYIGNKILPNSKYKRPRRNVLLASLGAFHLLKQNFQILKRWDFAVPAYNSGTKHLLRAKRRFKNVKNLDLGYVLTHYKSSHLGFASKNFYAEFLALVYILAYKKRFFPIEGINFKTADKNPRLRYKDINVYVSKCGLIPNRLFAALKNSSPHLKKINNHFHKPRKMYPRGSLIFSDIHLTSKRYYKLSFRQLRRSWPINYHKHIKNSKCNSL